MEYQLTPVPKPRMTQRDKWLKPPRPAVQRYREFSDHVKKLGIVVPESGSWITFVMPMADSWSKKKKDSMVGKPHQQKPDIDNLTKAILDSLFSDDCHIWDIRTSKIWGHEGRIVVDC